MGFYLLNISVDAPDLYPEYIPENLTFNDQESIIEIVVEKILGFEDAIKEYDDHDNEDHNTKTASKIDLIVQNTVRSAIKPSFKEIHKQKFPDYKTYLTAGFEQLDTPQPKI